MTTLALVLFVGGGVAFAVSVTRHSSRPPQPVAASAGRIAPVTTTTIPAPRATTAKRATGLDASPPVGLQIPSIGVESSIVPLGLNPDGSVAVPASFHVAGWYRYGVSPGQNGPAVLLGHVDSMSGPGVFFKLGALVPGARVVLQREDGKEITYVITGVREYAKSAFPTLDVYADTPTPTIRLVTCGGAFDNRTHHYVSNIVAFGRQA